MRSFWYGLIAIAVAITSGCTPAHTGQTADELAQRTRLTDSVAIGRSTERALSRQAQLCLVSDRAHTEEGIALLRNMQTALGGYFLAVGVESQSLDYAGAVQQMPCPGANYLFFVQLVSAPCQSEQPGCDNGVVTDLLITVLNADNSGLTDRITLSFKRSWLSLATDAQTDQRAAFEQLGERLTGAAKR